MPVVGLADETSVRGWLCGISLVRSSRQEPFTTVRPGGDGSPRGGAGSALTFGCIDSIHQSAPDAPSRLAASFLPRSLLNLASGHLTIEGLFMIWRARTLVSLLMARLLAVRDFDAILVSLRLRQHAFYRKIHRERGMEQFWELDGASR